MSPLTRSSRTVYNHIDPGPEPAWEEDTQDTDVEMTGIGDEENEHEHETHQKFKENSAVDCDPISNVDADRIIIAVDFGTTFSSVAYTVLYKGMSPDSVGVEHIKCIGNYPGYVPPPGISEFRQDVPTELWYDNGRIECRMQEPKNRFSVSSGSEGEDIESSDSDESESYKEQSVFEDDGGLQAYANTRRLPTSKTPTTRYWGFEVQQRLNINNIPSDEARPLSRFKLNLGQGKETEDIRADIKTMLKALKKEGIIRDETDIYTDYLTHLLRHTKNQLLLSRELRQDMYIQFVLCVPARWPINACRVMQNAFEKAVRRAQLSKGADHSVHNMFMISEPEAAAECILAEARSDLYRNETIIILDAGGGTVDAVTYKCQKDDPLRLSEEVVAPDSKLCGASYINERLEKKLLEKLSDETYLIKNQKTLKSIVQNKVSTFEVSDKRYIDVTNRKAAVNPIYIDDLQENSEKHFRANHMEIKRKTMSRIFEPSLVGVKEVLENQLELAESRAYCVEKIVLTGGFGQSPSLQSYLKRYLGVRKNIKNRPIELVVPRNPSTSVATGAVLRALNKKFGPSRITQCSYGYCISEPFEPDELEAHKATKPRINKADGEKYVNETIRWVIRAGQRVENMQEFTFITRHTFSLTKKELICAETLWVSDKEHPDHYRKTHAENKGAMLAGYIEANMTFLKNENLIKPVEPSEHSIHHGLNKRYWEVHYEVAMIVEGRSIRFEARWPAKKDLRVGQTQRVLAMELVGIAAAFKPGTV